MILLSLWANNISTGLETISDPEYQVRIWIEGKGSEVSSFDEAMWMFDDFVFDDFLQLTEVISNKKLSSALKGIYILGKEIDGKMSDKEMNKKFLKSAEWKKVMASATKAKKELDNARAKWPDRIINYKNGKMVNP